MRKYLRPGFGSLYEAPFIVGLQCEEKLTPMVRMGWAYQTLLFFQKACFFIYICFAKLTGRNGIRSLFVFHLVVLTCSSMGITIAGSGVGVSLKINSAQRA